MGSRRRQRLTNIPVLELQVGGHVWVAVEMPAKFWHGRLENSGVMVGYSGR